jgi:hypothetical protein
MATIIKLYGVAKADLPLRPGPRRHRTNIELSFSDTDLLLSPKVVAEVEQACKWNIGDILMDAYPELRKRVRKKWQPPSVFQIPVHKTESFPCPAMHIDESTLDGTAEIIKTLLKTLDLTENRIREQGRIFIHGNQMTVSLLEKVCTLYNLYDYKTNTPYPASWMST